MTTPARPGEIASDVARMKYWYARLTIVKSRPGNAKRNQVEM
jgi:hypothetical protein